MCNCYHCGKKIRKSTKEEQQTQKTISTSYTTYGTIIDQMEHLPDHVHVDTGKAKCYEGQRIAAYPQKS